ncbi:MAG: hypothetical protein ACLR8B_08230, partial [Peptoniphilus harei]
CTFFFYFILVLILICLSLDLFYYIGYIIYDKTGSTKLAEGVGIVIAAVISVIGVLIGYIFNKRQTYKEIVTKERKIWLNNLKDNLSEFMAICEMGLRYTWGKDYCQKMERAIELYYNIITNLNIKDENDRKKILALYHYAIFNNLDVTLNFEKAKENGEDDKVLESGTREVLMDQFMTLFKNEWEVVKREAD